MKLKNNYTIKERAELRNRLYGQKKFLYVSKFAAIFCMIAFTIFGFEILSYEATHYTITDPENMNVISGFVLLSFFVVLILFIKIIRFINSSLQHIESLLEYLHKTSPVNLVKSVRS